MTEGRDESRLREELVRQYKHIQAIGLNELASGNVSCRFGGGMLISASGATAEDMSPDAIVKMSLDGEWEGERKPSSEWRVHAAIYQHHESAQAVVHTHSDYCVALACHHLALPGFHYMVGLFGGDDVPCVPYSTFGTEQLAQDVAQALGDRNACLLGSHGMICRSHNLKSAVELAHRLEILCRQYLLARQLGEPRVLTEAEWDEFFERVEKVRYGTFI